MKTGIFSSGSTSVIAWDHVKQFDVMSTCFSNMVTFTCTDGHVFSLKVQRKNLHAIVKTIQKFMNKGNECRVDKKLTDELGKKCRIDIQGSGLTLCRKNNICSKLSTFVAWENVVSIDLDPGCCKSKIIITTMVVEKH